MPITVKGLGFGQRAKVTIAAVDEGILRLTKFGQPRPGQVVLRQAGPDRSNYRDDYGRLLDPNMGAPANVNFGADELGGEGLTVTPIKTVALWSGVVETGLDGKAVVKLPAADFNGELRIMAVAWTDNAVGSGSKADDRAPAGGGRPEPAALPGPRRQADGDAGAAQCRGQGRGLYGRGQRHQAASPWPSRRSSPWSWASGSPRRSRSWLPP